MDNKLDSPGKEEIFKFVADTISIDIWLYVVYIFIVYCCFNCLGSSYDKLHYALDI